MAARKNTPGTLLLFPGASSTSSHPSLIRLCQAVEPWACVRADFRYHKEGRRAPDRPPKLMAAVREELEAIAGPVAMGGRSMGGRICSMVAAGADGDAPPEGLVGLVLIAYPLHPPGRPEKLRTDHLPEIRVPCLFISGSNDPFATPDELERWTSTIAGPVTRVVIDGKGHDLKGVDGEIADTTVSWLTATARDRAG